MMRVGHPETVAVSLGLSSKGYYRLAKTKVMQMALSNRWLKEQGLVSLKDQWVKCRYPNALYRAARRVVQGRILRLPDWLLN